MIREVMDFIESFDPEVGAGIKSEYNRQRRNIELIASENFVSEAVMMAMGTCLTNKYAEGYPKARYYGGCECVDVVEEIARKRLCELFGADHANVQPHSGAQANMAVYFALVKPGDTVARVYEQSIDKSISELTAELDGYINILEKSLGDGHFTLGESKEVQNGISKVYFEMMRAVAQGEASAISSSLESFLIFAILLK